MVDVDLIGRADKLGLTSEMLEGWRRKSGVGLCESKRPYDLVVRRDKEM